MGHIPTDQGPTLSKSIVNTSPWEYQAFGPGQHLRVLHPENTRSANSVRKGVVAFAQLLPADGKWKEWTSSVGNAAHEAETILAHGNLQDIYISQQTFGRWRGVADLAALGSNYVDLDYHKLDEWKEWSAADVAAAVTLFLEEKQIPLPSYILSTGRGLVCIWLTDLLPPIVLPRWNVVQKTLIKALAKFGADTRAVDAARVFRLTGSINSRAEARRRQVGMVWCQGDPASPTRYDFGVLADEVLPFTQAEIISLRAERKARKLEQKATHSRGNGQAIPQLNGETYWLKVHHDLQNLRRYRNPRTGALCPGERDVWLFVAANALSWTEDVPDMEREIRILAMQAAGWSDSESKSRLGTIVRRAKLAAAGKTVTYNGREVSPRYRMRASTIVDWLRIEPHEMRGADLRVLIDSDRSRERAAERQAQKRRRDGATERTRQQADRLELGRKCLHLIATGRMTRNQLAAHFGVSTGHISNAVREARDNAS